MKKLFLKILQYSQENTCVGGLRSETLLKNRFLEIVFSCEYCQIFKNIYFEEHLQTVASKRYFLPLM